MLSVSLMMSCASKKAWIILCRSRCDEFVRGRDIVKNINNYIAKTDYNNKSVVLSPAAANLMQGVDASAIIYK